MTTQQKRSRSGLRASYKKEGNTLKTALDAVMPASVDGAAYDMVTWEGAIRFDESGTVNLTFSGEGHCKMAMGPGIHYMKELTGPVEVKAGVFYNTLIEYVPEKDKICRISFDFDGGSPFVSELFEGGELPPVEPVMDVGMRDCMIMPGPDGKYYMTGTDGPDFWNYNAGIHIYESDDLKNWKDLGLIWNVEDGKWSAHIDPDGRRPVWAPELHYIKGNYYLTYSMGWWSGMCSGLLKSTTGKVTGPYEDATDKPMLDSIDNSLFLDDDGSVYMIYGNCLIAKMNEEMNGFVEPFRQLRADDGAPIGFEGCFITKKDGKYYVTSAAACYDGGEDGDEPWLETYDCVYAVADSIYGPYGKRRLLLRNAGHNNIFKDFDGNYYTTMFVSGDNNRVPFSHRPAYVPITVEGGLMQPTQKKTAEFPVENGIVTLEAMPAGEAALCVHAAADDTLFVNGQKACSVWPTKYERPFQIDTALLHPGKNEITSEKGNVLGIHIEFWG